MKILHSLSPADFGGLESVVEALAAGQIEAGHSIKVVTTVGRQQHHSSNHGHPSIHPYTARLRNAGIDVLEIHTSLRDVLKQRNAVLAVMEDFQPDIFHSHGYRSDILDLPAARSYGVASVSTLHGFTGGDWKMRIYELLQMQTLKRKANAVVAVSSGVRDRAAKAVDLSRLHLIPNAFTKDLEDSDALNGQGLQRSKLRTSGLPSSAEARQLLNLPVNATIIGWIGRLSEEKGPDVLVESFALLHSQLQTATPRRSRTESGQQGPVLLSVIGDGPLLNELKDRVAELGISDRVIFHGAMPSAGDLIPAYDIVALTSRTEGTPIVLLEAMAAKVPIVATAVGGVPELLSDREARLVQTPESTRDRRSTSSTAQRFATALIETIAGPSSRENRAAAAYDRLRTSFSLHPWLERYESLYRSLIKTS